MRIGFRVERQPIGEDQTKTIYPQQSQTFTIQRNAQIDDCYCAESAPTKTVCHDVTKYKEVQKERQVSDYRPVTKYRTETQCN